jgi:3-deoxy-7-phosphoheptulonate synthase
MGIESDRGLGHVHKDLRLALKGTEARSIVKVGDLSIGREFVIIAGPCAIESEKQALETAIAVKRAVAHLFRGGAFKSRTSPYDFQGLGIEGLKILAKVREETALPIVTEAVDSKVIRQIAEFADMIQIGARNMQNSTLLREAGRTGKPVLLKRGMNATIEEWLCSAEYIMSEGNRDVVLCERGIRTFETYTRNTLDLSAVTAIRELSHLPIIVDPSHAAGRASFVVPMSLAATAAGADGIMVEVHIRPGEALCDKEQALATEEFDGLVKKVDSIRGLFGEIAKARPNETGER